MMGRSGRAYGGIGFWGVGEGQAGFGICVHGDPSSERSSLMGLDRILYGIEAICASFSVPGKDCFSQPAFEPVSHDIGTLVTFFLSIHLSPVPVHSITCLVN